MKLPFDNSYCIDTDALITLKRNYPKNEQAFKAIWEEIEKLIGEEYLFTIKTVEGEIKKYLGKDDFLKKWIDTYKTKFVMPIDSEIWKMGKKVMNEHPDLCDKKKLVTNEPEADPFLIALAYVKNSAIITQESKINPNKIPAVANFYQVKCINLFEFFNERGLKFVKR